MRIRRTIVRGGLAAMAVSLVGIGGAPPARADCVYAEFYVSREGDTPIWVIGENDPCITSTPWTWGAGGPGDTTQSGLPQGTPNGYYLDIRIPLPV